MATFHSNVIVALFFLLALVTPSRAQTGCCSLKELTCVASYGTSYQSCMSQSWDVGKMLVWYPTGIPNPLPNCTRAKKTCTTHTECCGPNVCSGLGRDFKSKRQCNHPQDVCKSFRDPSLSAFCESRPECRWQAATLTMNATCVPDFNYTFVNPATKPLNIIDEAGCCSDDHQTCSWNKWNLSTPALCTASSTASVWLRNGTIVNSTCFSTNSPVHCTKNSQCCGALVCAAVSSNPVDVKCRPPATVCSSFTSNSTTGIARCNAAPGCIWQANKCIVSFNATIFDTAYVTNVKPTIKEPTLVKSQLDGNPDRLGLCTGFVAHMHGDPHFNSFDRNYYNCMGTGAFVLAKAPGMMEIQGLFFNAGGGKASVARGIAIDYPMLPGVPRIQISMNETADRADPTTYMINNDCAAHIFLDGELKNAQRNHSYSSTEQTYAMKFTTSGAVEIQFFNNKTSSTAIQISVSGAPNGTFGCYMSVRTCLPLNEPELRNKTVGLLGTPNGNMEDEWKSSNGTVVPVSGVPQEQYNYCTSQHCVMTRPQSLFIYEGKTFKDLWSCNAEFPGEPDLTEVPQAVLDLCQGRQDCVLEGVLGGINEAVRNVQENNLIVAIQVANKTVEAVKFDITPPVEDDCKWPRTGANACPGDVALLNYPATPLPLFVQSPVNIVSQKGDTVTFNISNPFNSKLQAMYYQYYDVHSPKCLAKVNLAECIKPVTVTASCTAGRNANHTATLKFTTVDFWFVDPTAIKPADNFTVPECCQPAAKDVKVPTTLLTYRVYCESSCPLTTAKRHLRSSSGN